VKKDIKNEATSLVLINTPNNIGKPIIWIILGDSDIKNSRKNQQYLLSLKTEKSKRFSKFLMKFIC
jgi:hypothetical protein